MRETIGEILAEFNPNSKHYVRPALGQTYNQLAGAMRRIWRVAAGHEHMKLMSDVDLSVPAFDPSYWRTALPRFKSRWIWRMWEKQATKLASEAACKKANPECQNRCPTPTVCICPGARAQQ